MSEDLGMILIARRAGDQVQVFSGDRLVAVITVVKITPDKKIILDIEELD